MNHEREGQLLSLYRRRLGGEIDLGEYTAFDHLVEVEEALTYEEWEWMSRTYTATATVSLKRKAP